MYCHSFKENKRVLITYSCDDNAILARSLKIKIRQDLTTVIEETHNHLENRGCRPKFQAIDNEISNQLTKMLQGIKIKIHHALPHCCQRNAVEIAMRTFKNHFITVVCMTHSQFTMKLWCSFLHQAEMTLNMTRPHRHNPLILTYVSLEGDLNFSDTPLAHVGSIAIARISPSLRTSWAPCGIKAWVIGTTMTHCRRLKSKKNGEVIRDGFR